MMKIQNNSFCVQHAFFQFEKYSQKQALFNLELVIVCEHVASQDIIQSGGRQRRQWQARGEKRSDKDQGPRTKEEQRTETEQRDRSEDYRPAHHKGGACP